MARDQPTTFVALPSRPHEPIITLANLADKHASRSEGKRASRNEEKETPNKARERSFSPASDDESSTASYHGSLNNDEGHTYGLPADHSSKSIPMQVLVTGASTIEEQIANLMGAVEKLTRTVEEKDMQIAELYSMLENQEEEKREKEGENSKNDGKDDDGSLGSISFQQLQDIITNSIRAQYGESLSFVSGASIVDLGNRELLLISTLPLAKNNVQNPISIGQASYQKTIEGSRLVWQSRLQRNRHDRLSADPRHRFCFVYGTNLPDVRAVDESESGHQQRFADLTEQDQQNASFFRSKNSLEKLDEFKEKQDRLSLRVLEVEDWMGAQAPKNLTLDPIGASANEGTSKYIPPNEKVKQDEVKLVKQSKARRRQDEMKHEP
ncbi:hypothetical protein ACLB2K_016825 [Fragaria x ananassa]